MTTPLRHPAGLMILLTMLSPTYGDGLEYPAPDFIQLFGATAVTPTPEATASGPAATGEGFVTYRLAEGGVFRVGAEAGARPQDVGEGLDALATEAPDAWLNISPDGRWLLLETERFDPACAGWACLAVAPADLTSAEVVRVGADVVHPGGFGAIGNGGSLVVFPGGDGPHASDLWAVTRGEDGWSAPRVLTADSAYAFNAQPAISSDGGRVAFDCADEPYAAEGTALCEVGTDGSGFRVVLTPAQAPPDRLPDGLLHSPDYAPDGSLVFEADWGGEGVWRLPPDGGEPQLLSTIGNDNSPCVLADGRIVSLTTARPGGPSTHELKVMTADGSSWAMIATDLDIVDGGIGCGG